MNLRDLKKWLGCGYDIEVSYILTLDEEEVECEVNEFISITASSIAETLNFFAREQVNDDEQERMIEFFALLPMLKKDLMEKV